MIRTFAYIFGIALLMGCSGVHNAGRAPYFLTNPNFKYTDYRAALSGVERYAVATIWNTPGTDLSNLKAELQDPRIFLFELHLINEVCVHDHRCGSYETLAGLTLDQFLHKVTNQDPQLKAKIQAAAQAASQALNSLIPSNIRKLLNPLLETNTSPAQYAIVAGWVQPYFPGWEFVWNPEGSAPGHPAAPATISEGHGASPTFVSNSCIANPDGAILTPDQWPAYFKKYSACIAVLGWGLNDNCLAPGQPFVDPRKRSCPDTGDFVAIGNGMRAVQ